ncbi:MAG TPA: hypothetical protein PKD66_05825 [Azonexus sp.]|mgnify:FL=1|nr:hypothetical protein [Azonexus sp.]
MSEEEIENPMSDEDLEAKADQMLDAALGGLTPHEALVKASLADSANVAERTVANEKNRERALKLLAALEKTLDK